MYTTNTVFFLFLIFIYFLTDHQNINTLRRINLHDNDQFMIVTLESGGQKISAKLIHIETLLVCRQNWTFKTNWCWKINNNKFKNFDKFL